MLEVGVLEVESDERRKEGDSYSRPLKAHLPYLEEKIQRVLIT